MGSESSPGGASFEFGLVRGAFEGGSSILSRLIVCAPRPPLWFGWLHWLSYIVTLLLKQISVLILNRFVAHSAFWGSSTAAADQLLDQLFDHAIWSRILAERPADQPRLAGRPACRPAGCPAGRPAGRPAPRRAILFLFHKENKVFGWSNDHPVDQPNRDHTMGGGPSSTEH